jgi:hypothetical protein
VRTEDSDEIVYLLGVEVVVERGIIVAVAPQTDEEKNPQGQPDQTEDFLAHSMFSGNFRDVFTHKLVIFSIYLEIFNRFRSITQINILTTESFSQHLQW